jgi:hypothetical protein
VRYEWNKIPLTSRSDSETERLDISLGFPEGRSCSPFLGLTLP